MRLSLRMRLFALVAAANVLVFTAGLWFLGDRLEAERQDFADEMTQVLLTTLQRVVAPRGEVRIVPILNWPEWRHFDDAMLLGHNYSVREDGTVVPRGAWLNPLGGLARGPRFDQRAVLGGLRSAIEERRAVEGIEGGVCVPVFDKAGKVWGGCWYVLSKPDGAGSPFRVLLPWFLASSLLLTLGTFSVLGRFVLEPVEELARTARRVSEGDLSARANFSGKRRDEFSELTQSFNDMTAQLAGYNRKLESEVITATEKARAAEAASMRQRRLAAMGELAAGIAHEINNPLGGLQNAVEALEKPSLSSDKQVQYRGLLKDGLERIRRIVSKLLHMTPRESDLAPVALVDPAWDAISLVAHRASRHDIELDLLVGEDRLVRSEEEASELREALPRVLAERGELGQALLNLLSNALDALEEGPIAAAEKPRVTVQIRAASPDRVQLEVCDNGPGMEPEALERALDLFFTTKDVGKGTGLGLSIVHAAVTKFEGRLELDSTPGNGFRCLIDLPAWRGGEAS